ncbi:arsenate reductase [Jimgerdemannia flammicorona]|uniref:Arsenate reductase n=2 Tax=Jimgerdemannia flammicorona TaxID=994334 RepID=A0A433PF56_9FUNG|nr:arsenate reductase [Jimgerdemannia flammicorona]RUS16139.1 arsenate reductase [Jimgerdemannia flammicorona]
MAQSRVLFVCRHNSCRSQIAEGFATYLGGSKSSQIPPIFSLVGSAALEGTSTVNPSAVSCMSDRGVDISSQYSKMIDDFLPSDFDIVISMCGCGATVPDVWKEGKRFEDWNVEDPTNKGAEEFVKAREEIESRVKELIASHMEGREPTYSLYVADACPISRKH